MLKRELEIGLQRLEGFDEPEAKLEQYETPPTIAAEILSLAAARGELRGRVLDLGCGTGILAIGSSLLGADSIGVDIDPSALSVARNNARDLGAEVEFIRSDVEDLEITGDVVVQNPPFGAQRRGADRPFIGKALEAAPISYSLHNGPTADFVERYVESMGGEARLEATFEFPLRRSQEFHGRDVETRDVHLYRFKRKQR